MTAYATTLLGCTTYSSPVLRAIWYTWPLPERQSSPRPVTRVLPQCAKLICVFICGRRAKVCPVHAKSALRCAIIQSSRPSRCITLKVVMGDLVEIRAVKGDVEVIFWYMKGMPDTARRKGSRSDSVETVFSALPLNPTRAPLRAYKVWDAVIDADRRENGLPSTSN